MNTKNLLSEMIVLGPEADFCFVYRSEKVSVALVGYVAKRSEWWELFIFRSNNYRKNAKLSGPPMATGEKYGTLFCDILWLVSGQMR